MTTEEPELTLDQAVDVVGADFTRLGREGKVDHVAPFEFDGLRICWNMVAKAALPDPPPTAAMMDAAKNDVLRRENGQPSGGTLEPVID